MFCLMPPPLYTAHNLKPAYLLRYSWSAFPALGTQLPDSVPEPLLRALAADWENDGLRLLEPRCDRRRIQIAFSAAPQVAPAVLAARAKGRLQNTLRQAGLPVSFARNFSVRALGNNTREMVERYLDAQARRGDFADAHCREGFQEAAWTSPETDLSRPLQTKRGRYWYSLHLVFITEGRYRIEARTTAQAISLGCRTTASAHDYRLSRIAVMPDHLHLALQGVPGHSPEEIALHFQNELAASLGHRLWAPGYYAGTVGEYTMRAVRAGCRSS
jgi:REP element-mobilizing transposase RayT